MKIFKSLVLLFLFCLTVNCSKDENPAAKPDTEEQPKPDPQPEEPKEPETEVYFTFNVNQNKDTSGSDDWVIIHNSHGELLDFRPFESGDSLTFEALNTVLTEEISITLMNVQFLSDATCNGDVWHNLKTFNEIKKGSTWDYFEREYPNHNPEKIGEFELIVTDIPGHDGQWGLDHNMLSIARYDIFSNSSWIPNADNTSTLIREVPLYEDVSYLVSIFDDGLDLKYKFFERPQEGNSINLSYNEFLSFDSYLYLPPFPPNKGNNFKLLGQVIGTNYSNDRGFLLQQIKNTDLETAIPMGFLNEFDYYKTYLYIEFEGYDYSYTRKGPKPNIVIPNMPNLVIANDDIFKFDMSVNIDYTKKITQWAKGSTPSDCSYTNWEIHSSYQDSGNGNILPEGILTQYPSLHINELDYLYSRFYTQSRTYSEYVNRVFSQDDNGIQDEIEEYILIRK